MTTILIKILILAIIGSAIGYITNVMAIKLLFRPYAEIRIPIINFRIQGVIPKRQADIAKSIGETVENELVNVSEIVDSFVTEDKINKLLKKIHNKVKKVIETKILDYPLLYGFKGMILKYIDNVMEEEGKEYVKDVIHDIGEQAQYEIKIGAIVEEKINSLDLSKLESLVYDIAKKELRHIEILGGVLGFLIGIVQGIIVHLF